jgi:phosphoribosylamine--glycine ligase
LDLTQGRITATWLRNRVAVGVVLSIPDYPYSNLTKKEVVGIPIYGIKGQGEDIDQTGEDLWPHLHPAEMMLAKDVPIRTKEGIRSGTCPATAGDYVLIMTATADHVSAAAQLVYKRLGALNVPNSPMYRTDIGRRLARQLPKIQQHGYARSMRYSAPPST